MIIKFKEYKKVHEGVPYDTYNGPNLTQFSGDNRTQISTDNVAGGQGGQIGGEWYKTGGATSKGSIFKDKWKDNLENPISNEGQKRKKAIKKIKALLQMNLKKKLDEDED